MGVVVVRWADVSAVAVDAVELQDGERRRLEAMRDDADRRRFVGARALLRAVTGDGPVLRQRCPTCGGPHGRPQLDGGPEVSLAHAGDLAVVALAARPVGVDVEPVGPDDLRRWVRTEAVLKATGAGLDVDPSLVEIHGDPPRLTGWQGPGRRPALRLADVTLVPGYLGAVARLGRRRLRVDVGEVVLG